MKKIMVALTLLLTTAAHAEEIVFYERPIFMTEDMPLKLECKHTGGFSFTCFENQALPRTAKVKVVDSNGRNLRVHTVPVSYIATCSEGICVNQRDQTPVGDVDFDILNGNTLYAQAIEGYYLDKNEKGHLVAYKRGFGPKADKYPPYAIYSEFGSTNIAPQSGASDEVVKLNHPENQTYSNAEVWPVWCETGKSTCDIAGQAKDKKQLFKEIPVASWGYCQGDFCYGDESLSDVIGLNPAPHN